MGQWTDDEVGVDRANCAGAIPSCRDVALAVNMMLEHMATCLAGGGRIEIRGFGSFSLRLRRARVGRNPRTGTPVSLPARYAPYFKPGKELRARLNCAHESTRDGP